ncbi:serine/threonine protein phosphatase 1 [Limimaricola soesokkakensis]|uniref:Serine/threonine protein phosphatase 1 n=1 Tax=Limimaricola soesokkakensis TaxID=1343159 RepID=A0A1X7A0Y6_9RHOB|nr:metallophosphoesterase [Limimaricola soesokkakensis]PSK81551.1 serine/threonine protein phosphatase 1 [Limimaricola soesokkakensis]SLN67157.1 Serine/threonine-protein phosphatase 2 [Limimaricola soesokkakensis]
MRFLARLRRALGARTVPVFDAVLAPATPLAVIGDVHGRADLLFLMLDRLKREAPDHQVILVGDYLDRGEESQEVLEALREQSGLVCLKGNHEAMCLEFLKDPERYGPRWLRNGGLQTLASFGVGGVGQGTDAARLVAARDALAESLGDNAITWLQNLPLSWRSGNVAVVHAAADPELPISLQSEQTLLWGHPNFDRVARQDGVWIVHGHTIVDQARAEAGRIAVDTGAYASGQLSAAIIEKGDLRIVEARLYSS